MLVSTERSIVLAFDGDVAGREGAEAALQSLGKVAFVRRVILPDGNAPDELPVEVIRQLFS